MLALVLLECLHTIGRRLHRSVLTSHVTHHTSHITHHTSHITHHTSHITHHTSHPSHHTPHRFTRNICNDGPGDHSPPSSTTLNPSPPFLRGGGGEDPLLSFLSPTLLCCHFFPLPSSAVISFPYPPLLSFLSPTLLCCHFFPLPSSAVISSHIHLVEFDCLMSLVFAGSG